MAKSSIVRFVFIGLLGLMTLYGLFVLFGSRRPYDWRLGYWVQSEEPFGLSLFYKLLAEKADDQWMNIHTAFEDQLDTLGGGTYFLVAAHGEIPREDWNHLQAFVRNGGRLFIAAESFSDALLEGLLDAIPKDHPLSTRTSEKLYLSCKGAEWSAYVLDGADTLTYDWTYLADFQRSNFEPLSFTRDSKGVFGRRRYGEGAFYLHTIPLVFTNYHLSRSEGIRYVNAVLDQGFELPFYWDHLHAFAEAPSRGTHSARAQAPLQFILSHPGLRAAWYLLLVLFGLYLLSMTRRRQRMIPVVEKPGNTARKFLTNLARLQYQQGRHQELARMQQEHFTDYVKRTFGLELEDKEEDFIRQLAQNSGKEPALIRRILSLHKQFGEVGGLTEKTLMIYHLALNSFYQQGRNRGEQSKKRS